ncbi:hypothetical protein KUCAC02_009385, partial [Chaenocephalus aceratus]
SQSTETLHFSLSLLLSPSPPSLTVSHHFAHYHTFYTNRSQSQESAVMDGPVLTDGAVNGVHRGDGDASLLGPSTFLINLFGRTSLFLWR